MLFRVVILASLLATGAAAQTPRPTPALTGTKLQDALQEAQQQVEQLNEGAVVQKSPALTPRSRPPAATAERPTGARPTKRTEAPTELPTVQAMTLAPFLREATEARAKGNAPAALRAWTAAEATAERSGDRGLLATAAIHQAQIMQAQVATAPVQQKELRAQVITKYQTAIAAVPRPQQAFARNNLAVVYLQDHNPAAAAAVMRDIDWATVEPDKVGVCRYNLARAEEADEHYAAALKQYRLAAESQPDFAPAVAGAFRVFTKSRDPKGAAEFTGELVRRNRAATIVPLVRDTFLALVAMPDADRLLEALARVYAAAPVTPPAYEREHAKPLLTSAAPYPPLRQKMESLDRAFTASFPPTFSIGETRSRFAGWTETAEQRAALSRLLQSIGDYYGRLTDEPAPERRRRPDPRATRSRAVPSRSALARYTAAWTLDRGNIEAAVYAARLLQDYPGLDERRELLHTLVDSLFAEKGRRLGLPIKTEDDLRNLLRLRLALAGIFEKDKAWGPKEDPSSAAFQLSHAVALAEQLGRTDPNLQASPDLYLRAATAYERANAPELALEFYTRAAEAFAQYGATDKAREAARAAEAFPGAKAEAYQGRLLKAVPAAGSAG